MVVIIAAAISYLMTPKLTLFPIPSSNVSVTLPPSLAYKQITFGNWDDRYPVWSPNGSLIAYTSDRGGLWSVWVMNASGGSQEQVSAPGPLAMYPEWSPDSSAISYWVMEGGASGVEITNLTTGSMTVMTPEGIVPMQAPAHWSPDGSKLMFFSMGVMPQLVIEDVATRSTSLMVNVNGSYFGCSWLSDSYALYTSLLGNDTGIIMLDVSTGASSTFLGSDGVAYVSPAVGYGSSVAYFTDQVPDTMSKAPSIDDGYGFDLWFRTLTDSTASYQYIMSSGASCGTDDMEPVPFTPGVMDTSYGARWNDDATMLLYQCNTTSQGERFYLWNVVNETISTVGPMTGCNTFEPSWNPDGSLIAFSSNLTGQYHIWITSLSGLTGPASGSGY
jgi:dipeptidyl aminopeptidase/acylaminoacyl peptidase